MTFFSYFLSFSNAFACIATILHKGTNDYLPDEIVAGEPITLEWTVKNTSLVHGYSCDAVNYRLGFRSATPSGVSDFGGNNHPKFTLHNGEIGQVKATFIAPQETVYFKVYFNILDENGKSISDLPIGALNADFTVIPGSSPPPDEPPPDEPPPPEDPPPDEPPPDEPPPDEPPPEDPPPDDPPPDDPPPDDPPPDDPPPDDPPPDEPPPDEPPPDEPPPDPCEDIDPPTIHFVDVGPVGNGFTTATAKVTDETGNRSVELDFNGQTSAMGQLDKDDESYGTKVDKSKKPVTIIRSQPQICAVVPRLGQLRLKTVMLKIKGLFT